MPPRARDTRPWGRLPRRVGELRIPRTCRSVHGRGSGSHENRRHAYAWRHCGKAGRIVTGHQSAADDSTRVNSRLRTRTRLILTTAAMLSMVAVTGAAAAPHHHDCALAASSAHCTETDGSSFATTPRNLTCFLIPVTRAGWRSATTPNGRTSGMTRSGRALVTNRSTTDFSRRRGLHRAASDTPSHTSSN